MSTILLVYASSHGQTRKIAETIAARLRSRGHRVETADALAETPPPPEGYDAVIIGSRVQMNRHARQILKYIARHREHLVHGITGFFSVSMAAVDLRPQSDSVGVSAGHTDDPGGYIASSLANTGWRPRHVASFAGGLPYRKYNWILRFVMKRISAQHENATVTTDTTRNHEFTSWNAVEQFTDRMATDVEAFARPSPASAPLDLESSQCRTPTSP